MATYRKTGKSAVHSPSSIIYPNPDVLKRLIIANSGFIFDPILGKSYSTNNIGLVVLKYMQNGMKLDEMIEAIIKEFHVTRENAERDILEFINSLQGQMK